MPILLAFRKDFLLLAFANLRLQLLVVITAAGHQSGRSFFLSPSCWCHFSFGMNNICTVLSFFIRGCRRKIINIFLVFLLVHNVNVLVYICVRACIIAITISTIQWHVWLQLLVYDTARVMFSSFWTIWNWRFLSCSNKVWIFSRTNMQLSFLPVRNMTTSVTLSRVTRGKLSFQLLGKSSERYLIITCMSVLLPLLLLLLWQLQILLWQNLPLPHSTAVSSAAATVGTAATAAAIADQDCNLFWWYCHHCNCFCCLFGCSYCRCCYCHSYCCYCH